MLVTLEGIVTDVSPLQPKNVQSSMLVTLDGIVTDVSPLQSQNASLPTLVTLDGIVTDVNPLHSENAQSPMLVTGQPPSVEGIVMAPVVLDEIADESSSHISALPPLTVYVHGMPSTISVSANAISGISSIVTSSFFIFDFSFLALKSSTQRRRLALSSMRPWKARTETDTRRARFGAPLQLLSVLESSTFHTATHYRNAFKLLCRVTNRYRFLRLRVCRSTPQTSDRTRHHPFRSDALSTT